MEAERSAAHTESRFTPAWQPGTDANLQRAGKERSAAQGQGQLRGPLAETPDGDIHDYGDHPDHPDNRSAAQMGDETMTVYKDGSLLHFPGAIPRTPYTVCGLDAGAMQREERPVTWAGLWCTDCMKGAGDAYGAD